jgi:CDP-diacylglycerol--glycerol-3-phosphate 3-phosphatidyltransferase
MVRHIPNAITLSRGLLGFVVAYFLIGPGWNFVAFWIFILAIVTDLLDGWAARILDARSQDGEWMDPVSDKILTDVVWLALWNIGYAPGWLALTAFGRDIAVVLVWLLIVRKSEIRPQSRPIGQIAVAYEGVALPVLIFHGPWLGVHWPSVGITLGVLALGLSFIAIADQLWPRSSV